MEVAIPDGLIPLASPEARPVRRRPPLPGRMSSTLKQNLHPINQQGPVLGCDFQVEENVATVWLRPVRTPDEPCGYVLGTCLSCMGERGCWRQHVYIYINMVCKLLDPLYPWIFHYNLHNYFLLNSHRVK